MPLAALSSKVCGRFRPARVRASRVRPHVDHADNTPPPSSPKPTTTTTKQGSITEKISDWTLGLAIPVHMHITTNALVTDYVPSRFRPPARGLVLAGSLVAYLGIMKVNLGGPGLTRTVKALWGADVGTGSASTKAAAVAAGAGAPAAEKKK